MKEIKKTIRAASGWPGLTFGCDRGFMLGEHEFTRPHFLYAPMVRVRRSPPGRIRP